MKVSDYIVEYLIEKGITDVFGYPGGMITHLMESFSNITEKFQPMLHIMSKELLLLHVVMHRQRTNRVWRMLHLVQVQQI